MSRIRAIAFLSIIMLFIFVGCGGNQGGESENNTLSFDKNQTKSFEVSGLTCYVPEDWSLGPFEVEGEINNFIKAALCDKEGTAFILYTAYDFDSNEWSTFEDWVEEMKSEIGTINYTEETEISGCDNAVIFEKKVVESGDDFETFYRGALVECGDKYFYLSLENRDENYNSEENTDILTEILESPDYQEYSKEHPSKKEKTTTTTTKASTTTTTTKATTKPTTSDDKYSRSISNSEKQDITQTYVTLENDKVFSRSDYDYMSNETEEKLYDEIYKTIESRYNVTEKDIMTILYDEGYLSDYRKNNY